MDENLAQLQRLEKAMEINPYNLGTVVYTEDQVITTKDLEIMIGQLDILFSSVELTPDEAHSFDAVLETLLALQDWIILNKQKPINWGEQLPEWEIEGDEYES